MENPATLIAGWGLCVCNRSRRLTQQIQATVRHTSPHFGEEGAINTCQSAHSGLISIFAARCAFSAVLNGQSFRTNGSCCLPNIEGFCGTIRHTLEGCGRECAIITVQRSSVGSEARITLSLTTDIMSYVAKTRALCTARMTGRRYVGNQTW